MNGYPGVGGGVGAYVIRATVIEHDQAKLW